MAKEFESLVEGINTKIFDRAIDNAAMSRLFENEVRVETDRIIRRHKKRLTKGTAKTNFYSFKSQTEARSFIKAEVSRFKKEIQTTVGGHLDDFGSAQLDFHTNNLDKALGEVYKVRRPQYSGKLDKIVGTNIQGDYTLNQRK